MIGASKILTVSYGTFSCTLEGFEDPFNTMKAIAEYFRDLAAEDRYFGAEPPQPDAAMLHRIAEREEQRRITARVEENGVVLRAADAMPDVAPVAAPMVADVQGMPEGVAARLARIRAAVPDAAPVAVAAALPAMTEDAFEDEAAFADVPDLAAAFAAPAVDEDADAVVDAEAALADAFDHDAVSVSAEDDLTGLMDDADMAADPVAEDAPLAADVPAEVAELADEDDDLAALLALDGAEVADLPEAAADTGSNIEDTDTDDSALIAALTAESTPVPEEVADDLGFAETVDGDADMDDFAETVDGDAGADDFADTVASDPTTPLASAFPEDEGDLTDDDFMLDDLAEVYAEPPHTPVAEIAADEAAVDADDLPSVDMDDAVAAEADDLLPEPAPTVADTGADEAAMGSALADKALKARARVIRVRRSPDAAPPVRPTMITPAAPPREATPAPVAEAPAPVVADSAADDDLRRTLAALASETPADHHRSVEEPVADEAVARLMEQTRSEMAVPENRRRLSAIAHLKAAVAATVAERLKFARPKAEEVEAKRSEPYRDDLSRAVRAATPAQGTGERPAPLVLVSEQRIDKPAPVAPAAPAQVTPVRPRRVGGGAAVAAVAIAPADEDDDEPAENLFNDARGFAEFADNVGAQALPDLIEAAAAYAAAVEGLDQFTRPQLMRQVESAAPEMSREDGLRGFGTLLRDGRIVKVQRGKFALSDDSRYLNEARKIAG